MVHSDGIGTVTFDRSDDRGVVTVLGALVMVTLLVSVAFAVDLGNARQFKRQAQATADAAALAGAAQLDGTDSAANRAAAVAKVKTYALRNFDVAASSWQNCEATKPVPAGWQAPDTASANRCILVDTANTRVRITKLPARPVLTYFGRVVGADHIDVTASAVAISRNNVMAPCGLCVLGPYEGQNGDITVSGDAGVSIGGAASTKNNGSLVSSGPNAAIRVYNGSSVNGHFTPSATVLPGVLPDPLAGLAVPSATGIVNNGGSCNGPGIYARIPTGCTLAPGLYVITGGTHITGQSLINAPAGVTLYLTCGNGGAPVACAAAGQAGADVICTGQAAMTVAAPPAGATPVGGAIPGVAIFFDRNNTGSLDCRGNGAAFVTGTIYGASASLVMRGNGECAFDHSLVVVGAVGMAGNPSGCTVRYDKSENFQLRGITALVE